MKIKITLALSVLALAGLLAACNGGATTAPATSAPATTVAPTVGPTSTPTLPPGPQATLVDWINEVDAHALPAGDWEPPQAEMRIYQGGEVRAQEASTARVALSEELIRVAPNTVFTFAQPDADSLQLQLDQGQVWINVEGLDPDKTFEVETPGAVASVRGTRFSVRVDADGRTIVSTRVGTVTVAGPTDVVTVTRNHESQIPPGGEPSPPFALSPEERARWGMGGDADLTVVLPAYGTSQVFTYTGLTSHPELSYDGCYFSGYYYIPGATSSSSDYGLLFYDLCAGSVMTGSVPSDVKSVSLSPVGERLVYMEFTGSYTQICTQNFDGSDRICFGDDGFYGHPVWSPDAEWLSFYGSLPGGESSGLQIYRSRPDGSELQQLTSGRSGDSHSQTWSPDGERIAYIYQEDYDQPGELWVMDADGANPRMLYDLAYSGGRPVWSPDGQWLAFRGFDGSLTLLAPDDSAVAPVSWSRGTKCGEPVWSPSATGWPLYFTCLDPELNAWQLWYVTGTDQDPVWYGGFNWGPIWSGNGNRIGLGVYNEVDGVTTTSAYFFQSNPAFLP